MSSRGGTKMHCPECEVIRKCAAVPLSQLGETGGQLSSWLYHEDINWFRRGRECLTCGHEFVTSEINESFIYELTELRNALGTIKKNAEEYSKEAKQASSTLDELSKSLKVLKALKIYKNI